jgi:hypothetical protein
MESKSRSVLDTRMRGYDSLVLGGIVAVIARSDLSTVAQLALRARAAARCTFFAARCVARRAGE